jgi:hypothetical protein
MRYFSTVLWCFCLLLKLFAPVKMAEAHSVEPGVAVT